MDAVSVAQSRESETGRQTDATKLLNEVMRSGVELWRDPDNRAFLTFPKNAHREHHPLRSQASSLWLRGLFYARYQKGISSQPFHDALNTLEAQAVHGGAGPHEVHLRSAFVNGAVYLDLGTPSWEIVEVSKAGWTVKTAGSLPHVRFRRPNGSRALPLPMAGGRVEQLRRFLNVNDSGFMFCVAWIIAALSGRGPFPVLSFSGEQGTAKSTMSKLVRLITDPNTALSRTPPKDEGAIKVAAFNSYVIAFDNLSWVPGWMSDALCRLSTGGGFSDRQLYTDLDEIVFEAMRPVILNGIPDVVGKPDLANRTLHVTALPIAPEARRSEEDFWREFSREHPAILGALLTALSGALGRLPGVRLPELPRMADFAKLICAAEPSLPWREGAFLTAYNGSQSDAAKTMLDADPLAAVLVKAIVAGFEGRTQDLLDRLDDVVNDRRREPWFPKTVEALSRALRRFAPSLRALGWQVQLDGPRRRITLFPPDEKEQG